MDLKDCDYPLPKEWIAQRPLSRRDSSRLLVIERKDKRLTDECFTGILDHIPNGDVLVLNDTKVLPARLIGKKKKTNGKVELLLLNPSIKLSAAVLDEFTSA